MAISDSEHERAARYNARGPHRGNEYIALSIDGVPAIGIVLSGKYGGVAIVDPSDYHLVKDRTWYADRFGRSSRRTMYARTEVREKGKRRSIQVHRLLLDAERGQQVDHRNHNGLDNRRSNIRLVTQFENMGNQRPRRGSKSQYMGVSYHTRRKNGRKPWEASIDMIVPWTGKRLRLKRRFATEEEAALHRDLLVLGLRGEGAYLNLHNSDYLETLIKAWVDQKEGAA